jgi:Ca-activated chloride channel family protein
VTTRAVRELIPGRLPDLFEGDQLVVVGQYAGDEPLHFHLAGDFRGKRRAFEFRFDLSAASTRNSFVPRLWASRRIALLVDELRQAGANGPVTAAAPVPGGADPRLKELVDEIVRLSTEFGVLTEYTAFLATEGTDLGDWRRLVDTCGGELDRRAVQNRSGGWAVAQGRNVQAQREQTCLNATNRYLDENQNHVEITGVQQVCDRGMFQRGTRWIDGRLVAARAALTPDRVVELGTPEHARLVDALVAQGRQALLSLPGEVLIAVEDCNVLVRNVK